MAADTVMEITDNAVMLIVPGAMEAGLTLVLLWGALAGRRVRGFLERGE